MTKSYFHKPLDRLFILAEDYFSLAQEIKDGKVKESDNSIHIVRSWAEHNADWLFVYDNVDDDDTREALEKYIVNSGESRHVIITSRLDSWEDPQEIREFEEPEAIEFLRKKTGIQDEEHAKALARLLGYYPLALEQAASYIKEMKITYERYIERYKNKKKELLQKNKPTVYRSTIYTTFNVSIDRIKRESSKQFLNLIAYLASVNIPKGLFLDNSKGLLPEPLETDIQDEMSSDEIFAELARYSLISHQADTISIHKMLQEVIVDMNTDEWLTLIVSLIWNKFHYDYYQGVTLPEIPAHEDCNMRSGWQKRAGVHQEAEEQPG